MRVVVHHPARVEEDGTEVPESKAAFRVGRIEDHTDLLTGETTPREKVAEILLQQAQEEFPDLEVSVEHLHPVDRNEETGEVTSHEWRDHPPEGSVPPGAQHAEELAIEQTQEVTS
jgi:hypothetical protein